MIFLNHGQQPDASSIRSRIFSKGRPNHLRGSYGLRSDAKTPVRRDRACRLGIGYCGQKIKRSLWSPAAQQISSREADRIDAIWILIILVFSGNTALPVVVYLAFCSKGTSEKAQVWKSGEQLSGIRTLWPDHDDFGWACGKNLVSLHFFTLLKPGNDKLGHRTRCCLYFSAMKTGSETSQKSALFDSAFRGGNV
ncbi:hypothetical protein [Rhizobium sophoriradicis]|uniref:hypothetical protein n=1 Tax=Rhizobium sophoriradicis TaxID=1535245 RepID=UPI001141EEAD|nr:hypothetical protein [Rhizobium sophoriradicis]